jgi:hypothetical protein
MSDGNSSRKSSSLNSDSGIGASAGSRHRVVAKLGTLDVTARGPYKKKEVRMSEAQQSSLDVLLSKTTQGMSLDERANLRKSLVDELFEELIQRHHNRVLEQVTIMGFRLNWRKPLFFATSHTNNDHARPIYAGCRAALLGLIRTMYCRATRIHCSCKQALCLFLFTTALICIFRHFYITTLYPGGSQNTYAFKWRR